jgi:hypothetical protein
VARWCPLVDLPRGCLFLKQRNLGLERRLPRFSDRRRRRHERCLGLSYNSSLGCARKEGAIMSMMKYRLYETVAGAGVLTQGLDPRSLEFVNKGIGA